MHQPAALTLTRPDRLPRRLAFGALALLALGTAGVGLEAYLGRGPTPITVTDASGAATFNFRVTGIPVPGKIEGLKTHLTFDPRHLAAASGFLTLNLGSLDTGIALRDRHAREFLGVEAHPLATFTLQRLDGAQDIRPGQTLQLTARGTLDLNGVSVPLNAPVTLAYRPDGGAILVKTAFNVTFTAHHISIPGADPQTDVQVAFRLPTHP